MKTVQNNRLGIALMSATALVFAAQDGISRHLASEYHVYTPAIFRVWFCALFVIALSARAPGGSAPSSTRISLPCRSPAA